MSFPLSLIVYDKKGENSYHLHRPPTFEQQTPSYFFALSEKI